MIAALVIEPGTAAGLEHGTGTGRMSLRGFGENRGPSQGPRCYTDHAAGRAPIASKSLVEAAARVGVSALGLIRVGFAVLVVVVASTLIGTLYHMTNRPTSVPRETASLDIDYGDNPAGEPLPPYAKACPSASKLKVFLPGNAKALVVRVEFFSTCGGRMLVSSFVPGSAAIPFS